jgi:hypothetical protein
LQAGIVCEVRQAGSPKQYSPARTCFAAHLLRLEVLDALRDAFTEVAGIVPAGLAPTERRRGRVRRRRRIVDITAVVGRDFQST